MPVRLFIHLLALLLTLSSSAPIFSQSHVVFSPKADSTLVRLLVGDHWRDASSGPVALVSHRVSQGTVQVHFNHHARAALVSRPLLSLMADSVRSWLGNADANVRFFADGLDLSSLLPPAYSPSSASSRPHVYSPGSEAYALTGRSLAIWNSHGLYYEPKLSRWEWQRARLFTTVEDLLSTSFVVPFLIPMLENSGALVYTPRERDLSPLSYWADNDAPSTFSSNGLKPVRRSDGYLAPVSSPSLIPNLHNPFADGSAEFYRLNDYDKLTFRFPAVDSLTPKLSLYISYGADASNMDSVLVSVHHAHGLSHYVVDQRRGAAMWIYLGQHSFDSHSYIEVSGRGQVSVDAFRIGGGMGRVERNGSASSFPAWAECARYYLQASGFDRSVYAVSGGSNDYTDDVNSRGEWVNALVRSKSLRIDAALALHTDAGVAQQDSTIGTLTIVTTGNNSQCYSDGRSRSLARALAYAIEQQVVSDARTAWCSSWSHRGVWDKNYSEAKRADVPTVLLELLSHQNINDVRYALHPQFRFDVCRSIYKGILRFFNGPDAVVQPLPVSRFGMQLVDSTRLSLSWSPTVDSLEPSARPDKFFVYVRTSSDESCVGVTSDTSLVVSPPLDGSLVEYYVVAANRGGRSFPSMSLTARLDGSLPATLFVNGFDRLSSPAVVNDTHWRGIADVVDAGVPYGADYFRVGAQHDYDPLSPWLDDDAPGCGASFADEEMHCRLGSHILLPLVEGTHISQSKDFFEHSQSSVSLPNLHIDLGDQRTTWYGDASPRHSIYTESFLRRLEQTVASFRSVVISGAYVGTDIPDEAVASRVARLLGFTFRTNNASRSASRSRLDSQGRVISVPVAHPDAIEPVNGARTVYRYPDSHMSATIRYKNVVVNGY